MAHKHKSVLRRDFLEIALAALGGFFLKGNKAISADLKSSVPPSDSSNLKRARLARKMSSPQWKDGKFRNQAPEKQQMLKALRRWIAGSQNREPESPIVTEKPKQSDFLVPPASGLRVSWLGHSTMIVEIDGLKFLTDPVWGERASPVSFAGPKRFFDPPLPIDQLPKLDAVILSHDHYDHLCATTFETLKKHDCVFFVPLGVADCLIDFGVPEDKIHEFDWWESKTIGDVTLSFAPARHFSGRSLFNRNETLWGSWVFAGKTQKVFFSGDGAYFDGFAAIGNRYGPFDLTMIELGAYDEAWPDVHMGPEQAILAHKDLKGALMMPIHWATFNLALHAWTEPGERLLAAGLDTNVKLVFPKPGASFEPAAVSGVPQKWWPETPWRTAEQNPIVSTRVF